MIICVEIKNVYIDRHADTYTHRDTATSMYPYNYIYAGENLKGTSRLEK